MISAVDANILIDILEVDVEFGHKPKPLRSRSTMRTIIPRR